MREHFFLMFNVANRARLSYLCWWIMKCNKTFSTLDVFFFLLASSYLLSRMNSVTGSFFGSCTWAHDRFTDLDVNPVIIGRPGASGMSCTNKSTGSLGLSLIVQIYSPLSISFTGLKCKLKFFGFSDLWKRVFRMEWKKNRLKLIKVSLVPCQLENEKNDALTLWFCSNGRPYINFIIVWLDFQVNFSIFVADFSPKASGQANVKLVPARATTFFSWRLSDSEMKNNDKWKMEGKKRD